MSFQNFINSIMASFNSTLSHITSYINSLLNDNFIKFIIFLGLFIFVIELLCIIIKFIYTIFRSKHNREVESWTEYHDLDTGSRRFIQSIYDRKAKYTTNRMFRLKK